jgi:hypothetical protein
MSALRSATLKAWMALLFSAVVLVLGAAVFVGATPAAAQEDEVVTSDSASEPSEGPNLIAPAPDATQEPGVGEEPAPADDSEEQVIAPAPQEVIAPAPEEGTDEGVVEPAPADDSEEEVIAPAPEGGRDEGVVEPASADSSGEELIGPAPAEKGQSNDGGVSAVTYGLVALGGVAALAVVTVLTWRFRTRRA